MAGARVHDERETNGGPPPAADDPVLADLKSATAHYRRLRGHWEREAAELAETRSALADERAACARLAGQVDDIKEQMARQREEAERQRARAQAIARAMKDIHRALFTGNIYDLILKVCLTLTGGTRGLYVTARDEGSRLRVRAAVDVDGYPQSPLSPYLTALCRRVLETHESITCSEATPLAGMPEPERPTEQFQSCIVAPVVLLQEFSGIVIVADRAKGDFEPEDVETLLSVGDQAAVVLENTHLQRELQQAYHSTIAMLADAIELKDSYTHGHCELVSHYARRIAERLELPEAEREVVCYAALLHDVGKIGVSDGVLNKPGALSSEERELVRSHVRFGHDLIARIPVLDQVALAVLHHHEWFDGTGYPDRLKGEAIPITARIIAAVDAYAAMITRRSYKEAYTAEQAREELTRFAGRQFDPRVVEVFLAILEEPAPVEVEGDAAAGCGPLPGFQRLKERAVGA